MRGHMETSRAPRTWNDLSGLTRTAFLGAIMLSFCSAGHGQAIEPQAVSATDDPPPLLPGQPTGLERDESSQSALKRLARRAADQEKTLNNYVCRIRRREQVNGKDQPEEIILLKYCRAPLSIHCKWLGDEAKGREIIYVQGRRDNRVSVLTGKGDMLGAGKRLTFPLESPVVRSKSRYPLTEAGVGSAAVRFAALAEAIEHGQTNAGLLRYLGAQS